MSDPQKTRFGMGRINQQVRSLRRQVDVLARRKDVFTAIKDLLTAASLLLAGAWFTTQIWMPEVPFVRWPVILRTEPSVSTRRLSLDSKSSERASPGAEENAVERVHDQICLIQADAKLTNSGRRTVHVLGYRVSAVQVRVDPGKPSIGGQGTYRTISQWPLPAGTSDGKLLDDLVNGDPDRRADYRAIAPGESDELFRVIAMPMSVSDGYLRVTSWVVYMGTPDFERVRRIAGADEGSLPQLCLVEDGGLGVTFGGNRCDALDLTPTATYGVGVCRTLVDVNACTVVGGSSSDADRAHGEREHGEKGGDGRGDG